MTKALLLSPLLTEEQCQGEVSAADLAAAQAFVSQRRREEFLSWRTLLYDYLQQQVEIAYHAGAPIVVSDDNINIGVSHTVDMVAVAVSDRACAVDIERIDRDVERISERFFTASERLLAQNNIARVTIWCARECYYKLRRDSSLALLSDISVTALDFESEEVVVEDCRGGREIMKIKQTAEHIVVYTL